MQPTYDDAYASHDYPLVYTIGSALFSKMEQLCKDGIYQLIVTIPAETPKEITQSLMNKNWHSAIDIIGNKQWLTYVLSFLCLEDGLIEMEGYDSCNEADYLECMETYNGLFHKFEKIVTMNIGAGEKINRRLEREHCEQGCFLTINNMIQSTNGRPINVNNVLDEIEKDSRLSGAHREEIYNSIEHAMYLDSYQNTIDTMPEEDDAVDVEFDKIFNEQDIQLLNESLVEGFERYSLRLKCAISLAVRKYNFDASSDCIALMRALRIQMDAHLRHLGYTAEFF